MPTATFTADFTKFNAALKDATASLQPLEVKSKGVQQQLARMQTAFSGAQIKKEAQLAVAAIGEISNVTKLTEKEQAKLNATVTEAIAKYKALGQKAPADMIALANATKQSSSALSGIGTALGPLKGLLAGAFAVTTITRLAGDALDFASNLNDLSAKTGISTKALQEFKFAGDQVGVTLDDVSTAVLSMQKHLVGGDKSVSGALEKIGVSFKDLKGLAPEDQFTTIASALSKIEDPALRNKLAFDIMGKAAANVLPLIATDLRKTAEEAERLGIVLDQQTIDQLDNLGDTWAKVKLAGEALIAKALVPMAPAIQLILDKLIPLAKDMGKLPADFKRVEISLLQVGVIARQAALSFIELTKWTNPLGVATGQYDKQVKAIQGDMLGLIAKVGAAQAELKKMESTTTAVAASGKKVGGAFDDWGKSASKATDKIKELRDELSGATLLKDLHDLQKAWDGLTPAQKAQAIAIGVVTERYQKLAEKLPKLPVDLKAFAIAMNAAALATGRMTLAIGELHPLVEVLGKSVDATGKQFRDWGTEVGFEATIQLINFGKALQQTDGFMTRLPESLDKVEKKTITLGQSLGDLSNAFAALAQISGGSLGSVLGSIGKLVGTAHVGITAVEGMGKSLDAIGAAKTAKSLTGMISGFASLAANILSAAGAAIEFGKALYDALTKSRPEELVESISKNFGAQITEEFGKQIENLAKTKFKGNFDAAQIFSLDKIIQQSGITIDNLDKMEARLHDVFSMLETGAFTAADAQEVLNKSFGAFVDFLGGDVNPALKEIIRLDKEFGTQSQAIIDYIAKNADRAAKGFNTIAQNLVALTTGFQTGSKDLKDLMDAIDAAGSAGPKGPKEAPELHIGVEEKKRGAAGGFSDKFLVDLQKQLDKIGPLAEASFGALLAGGKSVTEALAEMAPGLAEIEKLLHATGTEAKGFLGQVIGWEDVVNKNKELFDVLGGVTDMLTGLNNAGALSQAAFASLTDTVARAFGTLTAQGTSATDALMLMQPQLQEIWELQKDFGYAVDDATQKLLDQAVAAGEVGEKHRSVQEQTLDVMKHLDEVLTGIGQKFGVDIPAAVDQTGKAIDGVTGKIDDMVQAVPPQINIPVTAPTDSAKGEIDKLVAGAPTEWPGGTIFDPAKAETLGVLAGDAFIKHFGSTVTDGMNDPAMHEWQGGTIFDPAKAVNLGVLYGDAFIKHFGSAVTDGAMNLHEWQGGTIFDPAKAENLGVLYGDAFIKHFGAAVTDTTIDIPVTAPTDVAKGEIDDFERYVPKYVEIPIAAPTDQAEIDFDTWLKSLPRDVYIPIIAETDPAKKGFDDWFDQIPDMKTIGINIDLPDVPTVHVPVQVDYPEGPDNPTHAVPFAKGGPVYAATGFYAHPRGTDTVPAMLTPGEFVISRKGVQAAGVPALRNINAGMATTGSSAVTTVNIKLTIQAWDGEDVRRVLNTNTSIQKAIGDAAMRGIERGGSGGRRFTERVRSVR